MIFGRKRSTQPPSPPPPQRPAGKAFDPQYDYLFTGGGLEGGPYPNLIRLFLRLQSFRPLNDYGGPSEPVQLKQYRRLVEAAVSDAPGAKFEDRMLVKLRYVQSAYICCFETLFFFEREMEQCTDAMWREAIIDTRERLIDPLIPEVEARTKRLAEWPAKLASMQAARAAKLDIEGATNLDLLKQMGPDDWHAVATGWNWDQGVDGLQWIVSQPTCDRATAVIIMCMGNLQDVAEHMHAYPSPDGEEWDLVWDIARRLGEGFYTRAELQCGAKLTGCATYLEAARATGRHPWQFPADTLNDGWREPEPKYTIEGTRAQYHPDWWAKHGAAHAAKMQG